MKKLVMSIILTVVPLWAFNSVHGQDHVQPAKASAAPNLYQCPKHPEITASFPAKCPKCGATLAPRPQLGPAPERRKQAQMMSNGSRAMEMRRRIMMNTSIDVFDPEAILCAKRPLGLTREQVEQLRVISMTARQCAKEVLNAKQRRELNSLEKLHNYPRTMAQMHRRMMQRTSSPEAMMSRMMPQQMMNPGTGRKVDPPSDPKVDPPSDPKVDPPSDPEADNLRGSFGREDQTHQNQFGDSMRDRLRDRYRDEYRDRLRDSLRDRYRDRYRDEYRDKFRDNFGFGDQGFGNEGLGDQGFGDQGFGDQGLGDQGFGNQDLSNEGFGDEGFGNRGFDDEGFGNRGFGNENRGGFGDEGSGRGGGFEGGGERR